MTKPFSFVESLKASDLETQNRENSPSSSLLSKSESELAFTVQPKVATPYILTPANTPAVKLSKTATPAAKSISKTSTPLVVPIEPLKCEYKRSSESVIQNSPSLASIKLASITTPTRSKAGDSPKNVHKTPSLASVKSPTRSIARKESKVGSPLLNLSSKSSIAPTPNPNNLSKIEKLILSSNEPLEINENNEVEVLGERGILMNKSELADWKGEIPLDSYKINLDTNPEIINKKSKQVVQYVQELAIRYLKPPTPPAPGEIIITQEPNKLIPPAPPLVLRQLPARPITPEPLVIREAPPIPPQPVGKKIITISGKCIPPPPRKVVIERFAQLPSKPQTILIERWLPFSLPKRRVIFQAAPADPVVCQPRNMIVQWETPEINIRKEFKYLGVINANPNKYVETYGPALRPSNGLPDYVLAIKNPDGLILAADKEQSNEYELEGDLDALNLIDLDKEGLNKYKKLLNKKFPSRKSSIASIKASASQLSTQSKLSPSIKSDNISRAPSNKSVKSIKNDELNLNTSINEQALDLSSRLSRKTDQNLFKPISRPVSSKLSPLDRSPKLE